MFVICETRTSTWHYHLRELEDGEKPKLGGIRFGTKALCGNDNLGWDTLIPLENWGHSSHIPIHWCPKCAKIAKMESK